jgi:hypothetical protein
LTYCLIPIILSVCHRANQLPPLVLRDSRRIVLEDRDAAAGKQNNVVGGAPALAWKWVDPQVWLAPCNAVGGECEADPSRHLNRRILCKIALNAVVVQSVVAWADVNHLIICVDHVRLPWLCCCEDESAPHWAVHALGEPLVDLAHGAVVEK